MIEFKSLDPTCKAAYDAFLLECGERGCEYNFANLSLWGRQKATIHNGNLAFSASLTGGVFIYFPWGRI